MKEDNTVYRREEDWTFLKERMIKEKERNQGELQCFLWEEKCQKGVPIMYQLLYKHYLIGFSQAGLFYRSTNNLKHRSNLPKLESKNKQKKNPCLAGSKTLEEKRVWTVPNQATVIKGSHVFRWSVLGGSDLQQVFPPESLSNKKLRIPLHRVCAIVGTFHTAGSFTKQSLAWDVVTKWDSCGVELACSLIWGQHRANKIRHIL